MGKDVEWGLKECCEGERDISNESQVYGLHDQGENSITYQARKYRLNCPSGRKVLAICFRHREVPINFPVVTMSGHPASHIVGVLKYLLNKGICMSLKL